MKIIISILALVICVGLVACSNVAATPPDNSMDIELLNSQIDKLNIQIDELLSNKESDADKIEELQSQKQSYEATLRKAEKLDNSDWVYPAKIDIKGYRASVVCVYNIKIHNGSDEIKTFKVATEPYYNSDIVYPPDNVTEWVFYDGYSEYIVTLLGKEDKEIGVQFCMPIEDRFYALTSKIYDNSLYLNDNQMEIMSQINGNKFIKRSIVKDNQWDKDMSVLMDYGLVQSDKQFQFLTVCSENEVSGNIVARNAIKWSITLSEFSR